MEKEKANRLKRIGIALSAIGPGLFMIGYNIGTGSITTLSSAGSSTVCCFRRGSADAWLFYRK